MPNTVVPLPTPNSDGRRVLGDRTRSRLLAVARELLAERGEEGVRLRDVTEAANANVAAVAYHFGSLRKLLETVTMEAVEILVDDLVQGLEDLDTNASIEDVVRAWVRPKIVGLYGAASDSVTRSPALLRIMARVASEPPDELKPWFAQVIAPLREELVTRLKPHVPHLDRAELQFRIICLERTIISLSTPTMLAEFTDKTAAELERLLVPVIVGALIGPSAARSGPIRRTPRTRAEKQPGCDSR